MIVMVAVSIIGNFIVFRIRPEYYSAAVEVIKIVRIPTPIGFCPSDTVIFPCLIISATAPSGSLWRGAASRGRPHTVYNDIWIVRTTRTKTIVLPYTDVTVYR